jgi:hypothetical protein
MAMNCGMLAGAAGGSGCARPCPAAGVQVGEHFVGPVDLVASVPRATAYCRSRAALGLVWVARCAGVAAQLVL